MREWCAALESSGAGVLQESRLQPGTVMHQSLSDTP
jgi:hypothetical protein